MSSSTDNTAGTATAAANFAGPQRASLLQQRLSAKCHAGQQQQKQFLQRREDSDGDCNDYSGNRSSSSSDDVSSVCTLEEYESQEESPAACCLLCTFRCSSSEQSSSSRSGGKTPAAVVLHHMKEKHGLDLTAKRGWLDTGEARQQQLPPLNHYTRIALVSFLRQKRQQQQQQQKQQQQQEEYTAAIEALMALTPDSGVFCCPEELLLAADPEDPLLWDGDDCSSDEEAAAAAAAAKAAAAGVEAAASCATAAAETAGKGEGFVPPVIPHNSAVYEQLLQHRRGASAAAATAGTSSSSNSTSTTTTATAAAGSSKREEAEADEKENVKVNETAEERGYFAGYGELAIHREMISDSVRTEAYRNFLLQQSDTLRGKVVLDVGCGSGVLSLFAAQAGARKVIALDASGPIVSVARRVVAANGFSQTVHVLHAKVESVDLYWCDAEETEVIAVPAGSEAPPGACVFQCDCLVSEWMGYCLLYECMLFSVLRARDKYLKPDGLLVPNKALLGVCTADFRQEQQERRGPFASPLYGLDFSALHTPDAHLFGQLEVLLVQPQQLNPQLQQEQPLCVIHLKTVTKRELRELRCPINVSLPPPPYACSSLVFYFDCFFEPLQPTGGPSLFSFAAAASTTPAAAVAAAGRPAGGAVVMSTSPLTKPTHWKQTVLHLLDEAGNAWSLSATPECPNLRGFLSINPDPNPNSRRSIVATLELQMPAETEERKRTLVRAYPMQ